MSRPCEVHKPDKVGVGEIPRATHRATYDPLFFPQRGKFRFDVCEKHALQAQMNGATIIEFKEDPNG